MAVIKITENDHEITIKEIRFIFTKIVKYERIGDLWYNYKLNQHLTDDEMDNLPIDILIRGKQCRK